MELSITLIIGQLYGLDLKMRPLGWVALAVSVQPRLYHFMTYYKDKLFTMGGLSESIDEYDIKTDTWRPTGAKGKYDMKQYVYIVHDTWQCGNYPKLLCHLTFRKITKSSTIFLQLGLSIEPCRSTGIEEELYKHMSIIQFVAIFYGGLNITFL